MPDTDCDREGVPLTEVVGATGVCEGDTEPEPVSEWRGLEGEAESEAVVVAVGVGERLGVLERLCVGVTDGVAEAEDE